jgi:hypothetical protein
MADARSLRFWLRSASSALFVRPLAALTAAIGDLRGQYVCCAVTAVAVLECGGGQAIREPRTTTHE